MAHELIYFDTPTQLAGEVARRVTARIAETASAGKTLRLALSGGRIASDLFRALVALASGTEARQAWSCVEFFWADERCVPPDHPDSNYRTASEQLLGPLGISAFQIHRLEGELEPADAARRASRSFSPEGGQAGDGEHLLTLDLILLGMGEDGHIASLFPGAEPSTVESQSPFLHVVGPKPPPRRLTMSYAQLAAGSEVWVLVSGAGKENALRNSLCSGAITPLGILLKLKFCTIFSSLPHDERVQS